MHKFLRVISLLCILILAVMFVGCQGEVGPAGPAGAPGPAGPAGPPGPATEAPRASLVLAPNSIDLGQSVTAYCSGFPAEKLVQVRILGGDFTGGVGANAANEFGAVKILLSGGNIKGATGGKPGIYTVVADALEGEVAATACLVITE